MYKMRKVFDITDMPEDIKAFAYKHYKDIIQGNGSYIDHYISAETYIDEDSSGVEAVVKCEEYTIIDKFMIDECSCCPGEYVSILYWW